MKSVKMWKSIALASLMVAGVSNGADANNHQYAEKVYADESCCFSGGHFDLSAELLFLKYCKDAMPALAAEPSAGVEVGGEHLKYNFDPGFRLAGGWSPDGCSRLLQLEFACLSTEATKKSEDAVGIGDDGGLVDSREKVDYAVIDLLFFMADASRFCDGGLSFAGGLRWLKHDSSFFQQFDNDPNGIRRLSNDTQGLGLVFRIEADRPVYCGWDLRTRLGASVLCAKSDEETSIQNGAVKAQWETSHKAVGSIEGALQLVTTFDFWCHEMQFTLGLEASHWMGLGQYRFPGEGFLIHGDQTRFSDQVTLWGFNAGIDYRF